MQGEHVVVRERVEVMLVRVADALPEIQRAWPAFETVVGLRGRKFYGGVRSGDVYVQRVRGATSG